MIEPLVAQANVVIVFSAITGLVLALITAGAIWVFFKVFDDYEGNVRDVQRFIELTNEARSLVPPGLPLLDPERAAATSEAIGRFQAKRDEARPGPLSGIRSGRPRRPRRSGVSRRRSTRLARRFGSHVRDETNPPLPATTPVTRPSGRGRSGRTRQAAPWPGASPLRRSSTAVGRVPSRARGEAVPPVRRAPLR